jgi:hypothetical protein
MNYVLWKDTEAFEIMINTIDRDSIIYYNLMHLDQATVSDKYMIGIDCLSQSVEHFKY